MYINIPSQYDIVSMAIRFHIGFYAKCKIVMKCICAAYVDSRKKHCEPPHEKTNKNDFCAQRRLRSTWAHRSFCWFCYAVAQFSYFHIETTSETIAYGIVTNLHMRN